MHLTLPTLYQTPLKAATEPAPASGMGKTTSTTGIDQEITVSNTFVVYPNPGTGQFTVFGENIKSIEV